MPDSIERILEAWRIHQEIQLYLVQKIPTKGFRAVPFGSKGRTVGEQLLHVDRVRMVWLEFHRTGKRPRWPRIEKGKLVERSRCLAALKKSGAAVEDYLRRSLAGELEIRMFAGNPVRWMSYLIAHEAHHRGSILLALRQNGMRLPVSVTIQGLWQKWFWEN